MVFLRFAVQPCSAQCSGWWYCCVGGVGGVSGGLCFSMFIVVAVTAVAVAVVVAAAAVVASVTPVKLPPACPGTTGIGAAIQHPKIGHFSGDCMVPFVKIRHHIMNNRSIGAAVPDTHWPVMRMGPPSAEQ